MRVGIDGLVRQKLAGSAADGAERRDDFSMLPSGVVHHLYSGQTPATYSPWLLELAGAFTAAQGLALDTAEAALTRATSPGSTQSGLVALELSDEVAAPRLSPPVANVLAEALSRFDDLLLGRAAKRELRIAFERSALWAQAKFEPSKGTLENFSQAVLWVAQRNFIKGHSGPRLRAELNDELARQAAASDEVELVQFVKRWGRRIQNLQLGRCPNGR